VLSITLMEAAKLALNGGETKRAGVIATFAKTSALLARLPFKNIPGNSYAYNQEGILPGVAFRGIGEAYTPSAGIINPASEALRIAGGDLDVDVATIKMMGEGVRAQHEAMKVKALSASLSNKLLKGDSTSNPREFDGFQARVNTSGSQCISAGSTNGGDPLSLYLLDQLIARVAGPNKVLVLPKVLKLRFTQAARSTVGGTITQTIDEFGRIVEFYNGIPLLDEYPENDGTEALGFDEVGAGGATATCASIYCASLADGYVSGIQNGTMEVRDLGESTAAPQKVSRVEWLVGVVVEHPRALARLRGISNAAFVA
jgi:hypothetical protein